MKLWPFRRTETRAIDGSVFNLDFQAMNSAGVSVSITNALALSPVWACVDLLSNGVATLPSDAFLETDEGRIPAPDPPDWLDRPSPDLWDGPIDFRIRAMLSLLFDGNAFVLTPRDEAGQVLALTVLDPGLASIDEETGAMTVNGQTVSPSEVMHIRGMTLPGRFRGVSPVTYAREMFGLNISAQRYGERFFSNGAWPGLVVEVPGQLSETGQKTLKANINEAHRGAHNAHKIAVLTEMAKLSRVSFSPEDSQFLQTRQFGVADIARMFRVPPHLIGDATGSTSWGSGLAEQNVAFAQYSLRQWVERFDQAFTRLWHSEGGPEEGFIKLNMAAVLRGSTKERYEAYAIGLGAGFLEVNEVRALEDLPPIDEAPSPEEDADV